MPSKSKKQANFMRAVAHGWQPRHAKAPPVEVAKEFVAADEAAGMYEGGLAPMNDLIQRGDAPGLNFQEGGDIDLAPLWEPPEGWKYGTEAISGEQAAQMGGYGGAYGQYAWGPWNDLKKEGWVYVPAGEGNWKEAMWYPPEATIVGPGGGDVPSGQGPGGRGPRGGRGGGRGGRGGGGGGGGRPPRVIPPNVVPPGRPPGGDLVPPEGTPYTPPDRRAGRDTEYSRALAEHRLRVAASLAVPPGGYAGGGTVRRYQEGGAARPGHAEGPNPYNQKTRPASYAQWERKHHVDPPPPPPPPEEVERSWLDIIMGKKEAQVSRTEAELAELEKNEAYGGYIQNYQAGGLASFAGPPKGGVPPRIDPRAMPPMPYGGATTGQGSLPPHLRNPGSVRGDPRAMPPQMSPGLQMPPGMGRGMPSIPGKGPRIAPPPGKDPRGMPPMPWRGRPPMRIPPGVDPRGGPGVPPPDGSGGMPGGPMLPPNLRGHMQRQRMMNRPRRGVPGPAGAGGAPNRVGQSDQQGGLARALQRGTGRPPMSRRSGFYR